MIRDGGGDDGYKYEIRVPHFTVEEAPNNTKQFTQDRFDVPSDFLCKMKQFAIIALVAAAALCVSAGDCLRCIIFDYPLIKISAGPTFVK